MELGNDSGSGTLDLHCNLVSLDIGHSLVELDPLPLFLDEFGDGALVDGVGEEGKREGLG